jgi:hypothetical protein
MVQYMLLNCYLWNSQCLTNYVMVCLGTDEDLQCFGCGTQCITAHALHVHENSCSVFVTSCPDGLRPDPSGNVTHPANGMITHIHSLVAVVWPPLVVLAILLEWCTYGCTVYRWYGGSHYTPNAYRGHLSLASRYSRCSVELLRMQVKVLL